MKMRRKELDAIRAIIREELEKSSKLAELVNEADAFRNRNRMLPSEWNEFKKKFLSKNKDYKLREFDGIEAIVKKSKPNRAVVKYIKDDMDAHHSMKTTEFFSYLR